MSQFVQLAHRRAIDESVQFTGQRLIAEQRLCFLMLKLFLFKNKKQKQDTSLRQMFMVVSAILRSADPLAARFPGYATPTLWIDMPNPTTDPWQYTPGAKLQRQDVNAVTIATFPN